ncbi:MAG TPA: hypothetical protein VNZ64_05285 [Candidatus Acidoferrum sp.]|nr:hypothetical protein [Candidatus Acidoferrum sp.]
MTLILGIVCKDGIVMAGDSQTTWGSSKRWDANKMREVKHPYGRALVAEAGATLTSARVIEELTKIADKRELFDAKEGLAGLAEIAVKKVRDDLRSQHFDCTSEELQRIIERNELDCELMLAHHVGEPMIHTVSLSMGISNKAGGLFETLGSGSDLATYLLTDLCAPDLECSFASVIAVHVVETVKRHDAYCGGPTRLGILKFSEWSTLAEIRPPMDIFPPLADYSIYAPRAPLIVSETETQELVNLVSEVDQTARQKRAEIIRDTLLKRSEQKRIELDRQLDEMMSGTLIPEAEPPKP